ncbi:MAG: glycoside hydrolase family 18 protein, partial [Chitinophagaceae bacterium]
LLITVYTRVDTPVRTKPVVIGYVGGYSGVVNTDTIDAARLTHINYAFVDVKDNRAWLHNEMTDTVNFRKLNGLKAINPSLKIMISIGGWSWSKNFSDAVLTDTSRLAFAGSAVDIVRQYGLDGVDIDWEYPGMIGDSNVYRPEDKEHYTLMFRDIRAELNKLQQQTGKTYLLTTAVGGFADFIQHTEMNKAQEYLDYINLMTYDYSDDMSGHHTNLYPSNNYEEENSAHKAVTDFIAAGVPVGKLVMGIAFYARGTIVENAAHHGLHQKIVSRTWGGGYSRIKDSIVNQQGFKSYWDKKANAPYLFNADTKQFISYDNERSVKAKCDYVKKHHLAGVMFWEYSSDPKEYLLTAITNSLNE